MECTRCEVEYGDVADNECPKCGRTLHTKAEAAPAVEVKKPKKWKVGW